jgi:hypothetical protein
MVEGKAKFQMIKAVDMMTIRAKIHDRYVIPSRLFEKLKIDAAQAMSVLTKGKPKHSQETRQQMSIKAIGRPSPNKGKPMSLEQRQKCSDSAKARTPIICHCGKAVDPVNFKRWHGSNCKSFIN